MDKKTKEMEIKVSTLGDQGTWWEINKTNYCIYSLRMTIFGHKLCYFICTATYTYDSLRAKLRQDVSVSVSDD